MKPCAAWAEKLAASHRHTLSAREQAELDAHVAGCPACAAVQAQNDVLAQRVLDSIMSGIRPVPRAAFVAADMDEPGSEAFPVPVGIILSRKAMQARRQARRARATIFKALACATILLCVLVASLVISHPVSPPAIVVTRPTPLPAAPGSIPAAGFNVVGKPTISAQQINAILTYYHSPAAGKGQALYDLGVQYQIDPVVALAFFHHESTFGRFGEANYTHSLGNLRCIPDYPCVDKKRGGYAHFANWEEGFAAWYKLIHDYYVVRNKLTTVNQIIAVYAPVKNQQDQAHRNYVTFINRDIALWRSGKIHS
ncbi:hypothetical protein KDK_51780 [Dictyobacter kobayashii]|uniref:Putative zinc-finger domain-containing protein n=1 Tax=Dictyobacter kobayashii TaxID=2014872 RepID=A0A402AQD3_9CHLR|nr:hypothetical protein KDK_51780 [Dictyobacter kobayashii]